FWILSTGAGRDPGGHHADAQAASLREKGQRLNMTDQAVLMLRTGLRQAFQIFGQNPGPVPAAAFSLPALFQTVRFQGQLSHGTTCESSSGVRPAVKSAQTTSTNGLCVRAICRAVSNSSDCARSLLPIRMKSAFW